MPMSQLMDVTCKVFNSREQAWSGWEEGNKER